MLIMCPPVIGYPKTKTKRNHHRVENIQQEPCTACGVPGPSEAHHVSTRKAGGGDDADNVMPLCRSCHVRWHSLGVRYMIGHHQGVMLWLKQHGRDDVFDRLRRLYGKGD